MLRFLTWNLALLERSAQAPLSWDTDRTEAAVREFVLGHAPDLVLFQELPGMVPFVETHGMIPANPRTHSGNLATLVKAPLLEPQPLFSVVGTWAILTTFAIESSAGEPVELTVANVHLAPGPGNAGERLDQLAQVVEASPSERLLVVGDTNTRVAELEAVAAAGLHSARPPQATWNSRRNRFRPDMPEFSAFFTRWMASPGLAVSNVTVWSEPTEHEGRRFHLSDHYALSGTVEVT